MPSAHEEGSTPSKPGAPRNRSVDGPADAAAAVGDDQVLARRAEAVGLVERFLDRAGRFERA